MYRIMSNVLGSFEGTVSALTTLTFSGRTRQVIINNDGTSDLACTLGAQTFTVKAGEVLSAEIEITRLTINGSGVAYRVWGFG